MKQFLIALDQLINTIFMGYADETISAKAFRLHTKKHSWLLIKNIVDTIFFWQDGHCRQSYQSEKERRQLPPEYRDSIKDDELL